MSNTIWLVAVVVGLLLMLGAGSYSVRRILRNRRVR